MNSNKKYILYLNTRGLQFERDQQINTGQQAGYEIIIADKSAMPYERYKINHFAEVDTGDFDEAASRIKSYLSQNNIELSGVICWTDKEVDLVARLGSELNLKSISLEAASNVRNKSKTRQTLDRVIGANPRFKVLSDNSDIGKEIREVGVPAILKPSSSSGGRGIFGIDRMEDAYSTFEAFKSYCDPDKDPTYKYYKDTYLLEEFLEGSEHSVAGAVTDNEVFIFGIVDKRKDQELLYEYQNTVPSMLDEKIQRETIILTKEVVKELGLNWCGFHVDIIVSKDGPKVLEVGGRLGGQCINSHLLPISIPDLHPYKDILSVIQGEKPFLKSNYISESKKRVGMRALYPNEIGTISGIEGIEKLKNHPAVHHLLQVKDVGDEVHRPFDVYKSIAIGYFIASCSLDENIDSFMEELSAMVTITIDPK